ncbi:IclR family transcriptional regulator [Corynebacterium sp. sy017]|uniref:IclR family transcriptional regulator n=1 Tax=unclassified Corynebacterium TaxID=2624378 RepID=UPI001186F282|nr:MULTISPECIES: IclR family transcriptional regulator [unclassified Corynebacterium]MBP3089151.1 IclR family transcriptional regulator [Corynebacterium sp. sy017]QDZ42505.1 IclR family transcriptional regulator [Corynebacterium sp. sy039]TSD91463.1 IclR family transcriptional regulator [Corynebacterium sp. SY003]
MGQLNIPSEKHTHHDSTAISADIEHATSGIKVLDRAVLIMFSVAGQPRSLAELAQETQLPRATAHRLATALEAHHLLTRGSDGRWRIGTALASLTNQHSTRLIDAAHNTMTRLMDTTHESVQLYQLAGTTRMCIAAQEPDSGLQNTVPVGTRLTLQAGSAAKVFLAYGSSELSERILPAAQHITPSDLETIRQKGWAESISEREIGLASCSAPIFDSAKQLIAVLSISGPSERLKPSPGQLWAEQLIQAANNVTALLAQ